MAAAVALALGGPAGVAQAATPTASQSQYTAPASEKTLRIATNGFVDSFNPFTSYYAIPTSLFRYMYENLVQYKQSDGDPTPGLAEKWETSSDGKTWTFHIRSGMKWSDGQPITAKDPAWTYQQMIKDPDGMGGANGNLVANFKAVTVKDDNTLVITMKEPQAANPGLEIPVVPEHVWSKIKNPVKFDNAKDTVGSGPFTLTDYKANQHIKLKANPNFWGGAPKIDGIDYVYYTNADAQVTALRSGEVDFVDGLSPDEFKTLKNVEGIATNSGTERRYTDISINSGRQNAKGKPYGNGSAILHDKKVRQAIRLGTDRESLLKNVLQGEGELGTAFIPGSMSQWALPQDDKVIVKYDPEAAKKLLDEDGWKAGSDGIREKDGKKLHLRLDIDADEPEEQSISEYFAPWMKKIGIDIKVSSSDSDTLSEDNSKGNFDLQVGGWGTSYDPDYQLSINTCASRPNADGTGPTTQDGYCNPKFDKLYQQQHAQLDKTKRQEEVREAQRLWYEDAPSVVLWNQNNLEAYRSDRFTGFGKQPTEGGTISNQAGYYGYKDIEPVAGQKAGGGVPTGVWVGGGIVVLLIIGGAVYGVIRRKSSDDRA